MNSIGWTPRANAFRVGWAFNTNLGNITFKKCDFCGLNDASFIIHKHTYNKNQHEELCFSKIRFEDCTFDDVKNQTLPLILVKGAHIKNLEMVNVIFDTEPKNKAEIYGDEARKIDTLLLDNVYMEERKITDENFNFDTKNVEEIIIE